MNEKIAFELLKMWHKKIHHIRAKDIRNRRKIIKEIIRASIPPIISEKIISSPKFNDLIEEFDKISYAYHRGIRELPNIKDIRDYKKIFFNQKRFIKYIKANKKRFPLIYDIIVGKY